MGLSEKFGKLTAEQQQQIREIKDAAALDALLAAEGIVLSAQEHAEALTFFETGKQPLDDDDLDAVAGGADKDYKAMAYAEGRTIPVTVGLWPNMCSCFVEQVWARTVTKVRQSNMTAFTYHDCKCYRCGHQVPTYKVSEGKRQGGQL